MAEQKEYLYIMLDPDVAIADDYLVTVDPTTGHAVIYNITAADIDTAINTTIPGALSDLGGLIDGINNALDDKADLAAVTVATNFCAINSDGQYYDSGHNPDDYLQESSVWENQSIDDGDSPYTASGGNRIFANAASGNIVINLNTASGYWREMIIVKTDTSANTVTVIPDGAETINGAASWELTAPYESVRLINDGSNWYAI